MANEEDFDLQNNLSDVVLCAFALTDCVVRIESQSAKYLRAVHRTALELAVPNLFGPEIGGFWLTPEQLLQLRRLSDCYPSTESDFVRRAVEAYLYAQTHELQRLDVKQRVRAARQVQNRERFYERAVKKKVSPKPSKVLDS
jgi:Arc/MetJ-type ribon-helix-helix transcriptional regulator